MSARLLHDAAAVAAGPAGTQDDPTKVTVTVSVDIANAFNSISRSAIADAVRDWVPYLLPYAAWMYSTPSVVHYIVPSDSDLPDIFAIDVHTGLLQGSAISQLLFDAAFQRILLKVQEVGGVTVTAIHDDCNITGDLPSCARALAVMVPECAAIDLQLRPEKSKLYVRPEDRCHLRAISDAFLIHGFPLHWPEQVGDATPAPSSHRDATPAPSSHRAMGGNAVTGSQPAIQVTEGIKIAGVPIGSPAYVAGELDNVLGRVLQLSDILKQLALTDAQGAMLLNRYCLNSMGNHLLRTLPPRQTSAFALGLDEIVYNTTCHIIAAYPHLLPTFTAASTGTNGDDGPVCGLQLQLDRRTSSGGFGIGRSSKIASIAHAGAWHLVANTINKITALQGFANVTHLPPDQLPAYAVDIIQALATAADQSGIPAVPLTELTLR